MESKFRELPPLKRYRLMQQDLEQKHHNRSVVSFSCLPAKKRKQSREPPPPAPATAFCLPAKKRVWAPPPDFAPDEPISPFDLNVEYKPAFDEDEENTQEADNVPVANNIEELEEEKKNASFATDNNETGAKEGDVDEEELNAQEAGEGPVSNDINEIEEHEKEGKSVLIDEIIHKVEENGGECDVDDGIECAVCQSTDGDPSDPIVFCDGCDLMVHSTCYGSPLIKGIPEGDWFCAQCLLSQSAQDSSFSCCLCPVAGGAMKPTCDGRWAHIVCAVYVPEVFFADPEGREGIDFSRVPDERWGQSCYVCDGGRGCAIDCAEPKCPLAFHVGCGLKEELCIEYREGRNKGAVVAGFCKKHTELWKKQQETGKFKIVAKG